MESDEFQVPFLNFTKEMDNVQSKRFQVDIGKEKNDNFVMSSGHGHTIRNSDLKSLEPKTWINDSIINLYFWALNEREK